MLKYFFSIFILVVVLVVTVAGFRGQKFDKPPIELFPDMDHQPKVKAQVPSEFFADGRGNRQPIPGTVPLGYADGVRRALWERGEVLIGGKRRKFAGVVTMDQVLIDCGNDSVRIGDEVVLLGRQGAEEVTANEWAKLLGTIGYEVTCGISARVPRVYLR